MGSDIHLAVGEFEIDWGKNNVFTMHGSLFQPGDLKQVQYRYVGVDGQPIIELREGASRPLNLIIPRLELMGFTLDGARAHYESLVTSQGYEQPPITFALLAKALSAVNVDEAAADYHSDYDFGEFFARHIFDRLKLSSHGFSEPDARYELGEIMENLSPYVVLRLLAENQKNASREVIWAFADVVENGWVNRDEIIRNLGAERKFLIVTEGSSDANILKQALKLLRPEIEDFFYFVDMEEGYPFTGTGNLHRFCQGLASIGIENRVVVVYDNDAEGVARFEENSRLRLPTNMRVMRLPTHHSLSSFTTIGPQGESVADINGRAAAIECYLDFSWRLDRTPTVRWTSYNTDAQAYQGELVSKQEYAKRFLALRGPATGYDFTKITLILTELVSECVTIAAG